MDNTIACRDVRHYDGRWSLVDQGYGTILISVQTNRLQLECVCELPKRERWSVLCSSCYVVEDNVVEKNTLVHETGEEVHGNSGGKCLVCRNKHSPRHIPMVQEAEEARGPEGFSEHSKIIISFQDVSNGLHPWHEDTVNNLQSPSRLCDTGITIHHSSTTNKSYLHEEAIHIIGSFISQLARTYSGIANEIAGIIVLRVEGVMHIKGSVSEHDSCGVYGQVIHGCESLVKQQIGLHHRAFKDVVANQSSDVNIFQLILNGIKSSVCWSKDSELYITAVATDKW